MRMNSRDDFRIAQQREGALCTGVPVLPRLLHICHACRPPCGYASFAAAAASSSSAALRFVARLLPLLLLLLLRRRRSSSGRRRRGGKGRGRGRGKGRGRGGGGRGGIVAQEQPSYYRGIYFRMNSRDLLQEMSEQQEQPTGRRGRRGAP